MSNAMTTLEQATSPAGGSARLVHRVSRALGRFTRRGFLVRTAVMGSALAVAPRDYVLKAQDAYATICGPGNTFSAGWTVFCCTVNNGVNACPPGTFSAGWWKAADSSWCCGGYRYIVDCNAKCTSCSTGCAGDHICDSRCWSCSCSGSTHTCDQRRHCCNAFRYGQCNTQVRCSGGVACRVVSCVPPYKWDNCSTTTLVDNRTAEHSAPCEQGCGPILTRYDALGANGSWLGGSTGPERAVGDGVGRYVNYQHGSIYWTKAHGARAVSGAALAKWRERGGPTGVLGYPTSERIAGANGAWLQVFEKGAVCDTATTPIAETHGDAFTTWVHNGRENGVLGYPAGDQVNQQDGSGWAQTFQKGVICRSRSTPLSLVHGDAATKWTRLGREKGVLGYPQGNRVTRSDGSWRQVFVGGVILDSQATVPCVVRGMALPVWVSRGAETGVLGYPTADQGTGRDARGVFQTFTGGEIWSVGGGPGHVLTGPVLAQWKNDGAETGTWGYPVSDVVVDPDGTQHADFEHGTITIGPGGSTPSPTPSGTPNPSST